MMKMSKRKPPKTLNGMEEEVYDRKVSMLCIAGMHDFVMVEGVRKCSRCGKLK